MRSSAAFIRGSRPSTLQAVNALLTRCLTKREAVVEQGRFGETLTETRIAFMRYVGQGHEIPVPLPIRTLSDGRRGRNSFGLRDRIFKVLRSAGSWLGCRSHELRGVLTTTIPDIAAAEPVTASSSPQSARTQIVRDTSTGVMSAWAVYDRGALTIGASVSGPAIIAKTRPRH